MIRSAMPTPSSWRRTGRSTSPIRPRASRPREWGGTYEASVLDIMEQSATGRVLAHDPATGKTRVVAHGLSFANGIALSSDGHTLFVNETGRYRVWKIDGRATDLDVQSGSPQAQSAARQSAGLSGQPHARTRRPHLGRAVQAAQPGGGLARAEAVPAKGPAEAAAVPSAARRVRTGTSSPSTRTAASPPTCRTRAAPIRRPQARPKPPTASTSTACMRTGSAGCRDEEHAMSGSHYDVPRVLQA